MELEFVPYIGALPLRFGMSRAKVKAVIGAEPHPRFSRATRDHFDALSVNYDSDGLSAEFCLFPEKVRVVFDGIVLLGDGGVTNPVPVLLDRDPEPVESLGFLVFPGLGVNITGFHDGDESQLAFNVFRRGFWDDTLVRAKKVDAEQLRRLG